MLSRLALSERFSTGFECLGSEIEINGVAGWCDPLGGLYLPDLSLLVVSDLHLEKGAAFARRGQLLPPYDTIATLKILASLVARYNPKIVVSLGDNFHDRAGSEFLPLPLREIIREMALGREWIWINGNHDPDGTVDLPGSSVDEMFFANLVFRHEPKARPADAVGEIAGHLHPSATVRRREKTVRRPCFATDGARMLMPAFGVMSGGLDLRHKAMSGLFNRDALVAHLMGRDRIYSVRFANLLG
ncbi:ligase-associated DNA damage response endonuclease PdeM [Agrobacterium tumefaciens]|uniref:ligase-associated DNA damage response endonuclease PdeM n=1 Tax=Agrobacterium tumefaciens TaxID=358 RepID=UPI00287D23C0|nr:ligase-associated DNA damage response endonuclease PdeM [Agrobacterium tumefaciens]MDS7596111.1 ligase-associated DNA damage response endonuclease PdeM [Agrobacterium tumefaciens]